MNSNWNIEFTRDFNTPTNHWMLIIYLLVIFYSPGNCIPHLPITLTLTCFPSNCFNITIQIVTKSSAPSSLKASRMARRSAVSSSRASTWARSTTDWVSPRHGQNFPIVVVVVRLSRIIIRIWRICIKQQQQPSSYIIHGRLMKP